MKNNLLLPTSSKYVYAMCLTHMSQFMEHSEVSETPWDLVRLVRLVRSRSIFDECFSKMENAPNKTKYIGCLLTNLRNSHQKQA